MPGICDPCLGKKRGASQTRAGEKNADPTAPVNPNAPRLSRDEQRQFNTVSPKVVIIGAGAAGLAAAQRLADSNFNNIMILEAQNYVGGRICSVAIDDGFIEKGAQYLHGENNLASMVNQSNMVDQQQADASNYIHVSAKEHSDFAALFLVDEDSQLKEQSPDLVAEVRKDTQKTINEIIEKCKDAAAALTGDNTGESRQSSLGHYLRTEFDKYVSTHDDESSILKAYRWAVYDWMTRIHLSDNSCRSLYEVSLAEYSKYAGTLEATPLKVPMLEALKLCAPFAMAEKAPVMLSKSVKQLRFDPSSPNPVVIACDDGQLFIADHCIVTASLGFLKKNHETFFVPQLSGERAKAISEAGFGTVNKIFLTFAEPFWKNAYGDIGGFQLLYLNDPRGSQQKAWHRSITGFDVCPTLANTLLAWIGGSDQSEAVEKLNENEIGADCQALLQSFMKGLIVPPPVRVIRTTWANNPYTLGTYSNAAVNQGENINILGQPTWFYRKSTNSASVATSTDPEVMTARKSMDGYQLPGLLFAGEATHPTWFSTVPGALESGKREADRLIELYKPLVEQMQRKSVTMQDQRTSIGMSNQERTSLTSGGQGQERGSLPGQGIQTSTPGERKSLEGAPAPQSERKSLPVQGAEGKVAPPQRSQSQDATRIGQPGGYPASRMSGQQMPAQKRSMAKDQ